MENTLAQYDTPKKVSDLLASCKSQIAAALPKHLTADRMLRLILTEINLTPKLRECTVSSILGAIIKSSQLGLEPGSSLGQAYLIPYGNKCTFQIGYKGYLDLAYRSNAIQYIEAHSVHRNDYFEYEYGTGEFLKHKPAHGDRGEYLGTYAGARLKNGAYRFEFMTKSEIDNVRSSSATPNKGAWVTHYAEMAKKTVIKRLCKYLPLSVEIQQAIIADEQGELGIQENDSFFTIDAEPIQTAPKQEQRATEILQKAIKENKAQQEGAV